MNAVWCSTVATIPSMGTHNFMKFVGILCFHQNEIQTLSWNRMSRIHPVDMTFVTYDIDACFILNEIALFLISFSFFFFSQHQIGSWFILFWFFNRILIPFQEHLFLYYRKMWADFISIFVHILKCGYIHKFKKASLPYYSCLLPEL